MSAMTFEQVGQPGSHQPCALMKPRLSPVSEVQWTDSQRALAVTFGRHGRVDNGLATFLHCPPLVDALLPYSVHLSEESTLSSRHRALLILRASWLCGNGALWSTHAARAGHAGLTPGEAHRIAQGWDAPGWDALEATLLLTADELYRNASLCDATWSTLSAHYDIPQLLDTVETVNHFIALAMVYNSLGIQPDTTSDPLPSDVRYRIDVPAREPALRTARLTPLAGSGFSVTRTFQRHPALNTPRARRLAFLTSGSPLSPRHREMLILRIGWHCQSEYEWAQHVGSVGRAREHGLEPIHIALGPGAPGWTPVEQAILTAVDELYRDRIVSDRTWTMLSTIFDADLLITALLTASTYWALSASLNAIGVQLEPGNERFPDIARL